MKRKECIPDSGHWPMQRASGEPGENTEELGRNQKMHRLKTGVFCFFFSFLLLLLFLIKNKRESVLIS